MIITGLVSWQPKAERFIATCRENFDGQIKMFISEISEPDIKRLLSAYAADIYQCDIDRSLWKIKAKQLCWRWQLLNGLFEAHPDEVILVSDVADVCFQSPVQQADWDGLEANTILLCTEGVPFRTEKYNRDWVLESPDFTHIPADWQSREVMNCGTLLGRGKDLLTLGKSLLACTYGSGSDQSELNIYIWNHPEINWKVEKNLWAALNYNFGGLDLDGKMTSKEGVAVPLCHGQGQFKRVLDVCFPLTPSLEGDVAYHRLQIKSLVKIIKEMKKCS